MAEVINNITSMVQAVIAWGGDVVTALFSGTLAPILPFIFVGLTLTLIHFFLMIVQRFSRG